MQYRRRVQTLQWNTPLHTALQLKCDSDVPRKLYDTYLQEYTAN